jgi:peptidoglycan/LPS O-acetylase OafA/YrhL
MIMLKAIANPGPRPYVTELRARAPGSGGRTLAELSEGGRRANNFDLLRLLAATCVVFAHAFDLLKLPEPFPDLVGLSWGVLGVIIFFSISGFLISRSWDNAPRLRTFAANRALRLMPGLAVAVLVQALVLGPLLTTLPVHVYLQDPDTKAFVLNNVLMQTDYVLPGVFVHNVYPIAVNGSLWTLPLEVKAYALVVLCGLIGLAIRWRGVIIVVAVFAAVCLSGSIRSALPGANHFVALLQDIQMPPAIVSGAAVGDLDIYTLVLGSFLIGASLYWLRRWVPLIWPLATAAAAAIVLSIIAGGTAPETVIMLVTPYLVLCVAYRTSDYVCMPRRLGDHSYGIYVYAFAIEQTLSQLLTPSSGWVLFVCAFPAAFVAGLLSWRFVKHPALALKRRSTHPQPMTAPGPSA